jgi:hypothetical protein
MRTLSRSGLRVAAIVLVELVGLVALLLFAANVVIPLAAPPPNLPTPTLPLDALRDCPRIVPGCR